MANLSGKGQFGKDKDPKISGSKGGAKKKIKYIAQNKAKKELKSFLDLSITDYEKFMTTKEPMGNVNEVAKAILAGERGLEYFLQQDIALAKAYSDEAVKLEDRTFKEKFESVTKRAYFVKSMKESIYGSKARNEIKIEEKGKIDILFDRLGKEEKD